MKNKLITTLLAGALLALVVYHAPAIDDQERYLTKQSSGAAYAEVFFPAGAAQIPVLTHIEAKSDLGQPKLLMYSATHQVVLTNGVGSGETNLLVATTNGFAAADRVLIQLNDSVSTVITGTVHATVGTTNIQLTVTIGTAATNGSVIYRMGNIRTNYLDGTNAIRISSPAVFAGKLRTPIWLRVNGTSACSIDLATVKYE